MSTTTAPQTSSSIASFDALSQIDAGELSVGYVDAGPADHRGLT